MSNIEKAVLNLDGDHVDITVPIVKVRPEKRTVIGIATTDAVDHANEVVTFAASKKAFENTKARIRTQHDKKGGAVGKIVNFEAKTVWNDELKKVVNAIEVEAYISETEQDVWTKVKEGLYGGFSIGGYTKKSEERFAKDASGKPTNKIVKYITDYELTELSLVDNPCNPLATIISIQKSETGGDIIKGIATDVETENVFWNNETKELRLDKSAELEGYENIGWVETSKTIDDESRSEQLERILQLHLSLVKSDEGGVTNNMSEKEVTTEEVVVEEVPTEEVAEQPKVEEEKAVEVEEVPAEDTDLKKLLDELRLSITETVEKVIDKSNQQNTEALADVNEKIVKAQESLTEISALNEKFEELSKTVTDLKSQVSTVEKSVSALETDTAIKKSSDLGGSKEIKKSKSEDLWVDSALSMRRV